MSSSSPYLGVPSPRSSTVPSTRPNNVAHRPPSVGEAQPLLAQVHSSAYAHTYAHPGFGSANGSAKGKEREKEVIVISDSEDDAPSSKTTPKSPSTASANARSQPQPTGDRSSTWHPFLPLTDPHLMPHPHSGLPKRTSGLQPWLPFIQHMVTQPARERPPSSSSSSNPHRSLLGDGSPSLHSQRARPQTPAAQPPQLNGSLSSSPFQGRTFPTHSRLSSTSTASPAGVPSARPPPSPASVLRSPQTMAPTPTSHTARSPPVSGKSCIRCARTNLGCDGAFPCSTCRQRGDEVRCSYQVTSQPSSPTEQQSKVVRLKLDPTKSAHSSAATLNSNSVHPSTNSALNSFSNSSVSPNSHLNGINGYHPRQQTAAPSRPGPVPTPPMPRDAARTTKPGVILRPHRDYPTPPRQFSATAKTSEHVQNGNGYGNGMSHNPRPGLQQHASPQRPAEAQPRPIAATPSPSVGIEPTVTAVQTLLENLRKELHLWQERSVQAELRQAEIDTRHAARPHPGLNIQDPFRAITEKRRAESGMAPPSIEPTDGPNAPSKPAERLQHKKPAIIRAPESSFQTNAVLLPKYKAIGRVSSSFLAPNVRTAKYRPYDAEDEVQDPDATEKYAELEQRFNNNHPSLKSQRNCQELVWMWTPWAEELLSRLGITKDDVLYFFTQDHFDSDRQLDLKLTPEDSAAWRQEQTRRCRTCELADPESRWAHFSDTFNSIPVPTASTLALAGLAAHTFHTMTGVSLWHVALGGLLQPRYEDPKAVTRKAPAFCLICFRHHCPDHGSFEEPNEDDHSGKDPDEPQAFINDEEHDHNLRKFMALPAREPNARETHLCGVFCVDPSLPLRSLLGLHADRHVVEGECRPMPPTIDLMADSKICSSYCFWYVHTRREVRVSDVKFQPFLSPSQMRLVDKLIPFYVNMKRGPCLIARILADVTCQAVFHHMLFRICRVPHPGADNGATSDSSTAPRTHNHARKKRKQLPPPDVSRSAELDQRPSFVPCSHSGPCHNNPACSCWRSKVHCERFCGCDDSCKRRFRGCSCQPRGNKICFKDNRCECWKLNRECDPYLCGKCGVVEVLDSSNKYNDEVRIGRCRNNRIQLGLPAPTTKAPSQVQGYGLYSRADIAGGDFIGEYTGEIVSITEGDRRGAMYHVLNQEYLFVINKAQEIDASNNGNKMRFMNNSTREENINVEPKKLWCSGVVRVGLFAKRAVSAGEELLYNYNYPESVVQNFWEPGERPANARGMIPLAQERIARTTGANPLDGRADSSQPPLLARHLKRKRPVAESPDNTWEGRSSHGDGTASDGPLDPDSADELQRLAEVDDSNDSDYEVKSGVSDGDAEDEAAGNPALHGATRNRSRREKPSRGTSSGKSRRAPVGNGRRTNGPTSPGKNSARTAVQKKGGARLSKTDGVAPKRKRRIGPNDRRYGGKAQQQAWRTRRMNESASAAR